jgi:hypothetical protein
VIRQLSARAARGGGGRSRPWQATPATGPEHYGSGAGRRPEASRECARAAAVHARPWLLCGLEQFLCPEIKSWLIKQHLTMIDSQLRLRVVGARSSMVPSRGPRSNRGLRAMPLSPGGDSAWTASLVAVDAGGVAACAARVGGREVPATGPGLLERSVELRAAGLKRDATLLGDVPARAAASRRVDRRWSGDTSTASTGADRGSRS